MIKLQIKDKIAKVILDNLPKKNALSMKLLEQLNEAISQIESRKDLRVLIFTGQGDEMFCAGADLKERMSLDEEETLRLVKNIQKTFSKIVDLSIPTIAALNGHAFGGGLELALACDLRLAVSHVCLGLTECSLGVIPGAGGTQRLTWLVGLSKSLEMILLAKKISAKEALRIGLINYVVENSQDLEETCKEWAAKICENAPLSIKASKKSIYNLYRNNMEKLLKFELLCYKDILYTKDRLEGLKAFKEKRKAYFSGT